VSAFARSIDSSYKRIQFTPDVMPSDITGFSIFNPKIGDFEYKKGAVLHQFVQADEINRTSSKTQAALLEVMEEHQVTVDGTTYAAPSPFIVFATQNPAEYVGTFALPEAQLDRFFIRISLGYPQFEEEVRIILSRKGENLVKTLNPVTTADEILAIGRKADEVHLDEKVGSYIVKLIQATRDHPAVSLGASPRASINLAKAGRAWALYNGRDYVIPDDIQKMAVSVIGHRLTLKREARFKNLSAYELVGQIVAETQVL
ncbi:MAG: MoxR family ATPase, partial [Oscillospiraceae bacterium]|nr:MoxR family ATPase [Oscillospiraceae bacterium]